MVLYPQSGPHEMDKASGIMFFTDMQKNSVSCWNIKEDFKPSNLRQVHQDNRTLIYPVDLTVKSLNFHPFFSKT